MMRRGSKAKTTALAVLGFGAFACGDDSSTSPWDAGSTGAAEGTQNADDDGPSPGEGTAAGDGSSGGDATADDTAAGSDGAGIKLDVGGPTDGFGGCGCDLSYIWIANATESTVSKINTRTLVEEGRYLTRADGVGNPSRTSVNLAGDVAVANRHGGLVKFYAETEDCVDANGDGVIQTSTGKDDVLAWEDEECRAWYLAFNATNQRPVAWTAGAAGPDACDGNDAHIWTVTSAVPGLFPGMGGAGGVIAHLVDGTAGAVIDSVDFPDFPGGSFGAYGGAVDSDDNLWITTLGTPAGTLGRVDAETHDTQTWPMPQGVASYGITVDHLGRPWVSSTLGSIAARFDPVSEQWGIVEGFGGGAGLAEGPDGRMWVSAGGGVHGVDLESLVIGPQWTGDQALKGVGFDGDGFLWAVTWKDPEDPMSVAAAYKIDTATLTVDGAYTGLTDPYTYSDMTGYALDTVTCPPAG